jgi:large subunit ribosomal protein L10
MARAEKVAAVDGIADEFRSSSGAVLTEYRGLSVAQLMELRRALGENATYAVVKNTLTKLAADQAGVVGVSEHLVGPTAIAFVKGDVVEAAKSLRDFARMHAPLVIKGGVLDGRVITPAEIAKLADLESRDVLLARLVGGLKASLQQAVYLFDAPLSQAARMLGALQEKWTEDGDHGPAAAAPEATAEEMVPDGSPAAETGADSPADAAPTDEPPADGTPADETPADVATAEEPPPSDVIPADETPADAAAAAEPTDQG